MRLAIIGASGRTGRELVGEALDRGHSVSAACRTTSAPKLDPFAERERFALHTGEVVSDPVLLERTLAGCDAVVAVLMTVRRLKATALVRNLAGAADRRGVRRAVFTSGEITSEPDPGERFTRRQRILLPVACAIASITPYSVSDMIRASRIIKDHDWDWTIVRAPTLVDGEPAGHRFVEVGDVTGRDRLTRRDYARAMLDGLEDEEANRRSVTVVGAG